VSPARQEALCRQLAETKGWEVVRVFADRDLSGWKEGTKRPGFTAMERAVEGGQVDAVMAYSLSRLGRRATRLLSFAESLQEHGVDLVLHDNAIDTTSAAGRMFFTFIAGMAQMESEQKSESVKSSTGLAAAAGRMHTGGHRQFGYNRDATVREDEAAVVREIAERLLGGESIRNVAYDLNERGVLTTAGKPWAAGALSQMIRSPLSGKYHRTDNEHHDEE